MWNVANCIKREMIIAAKRLVSWLNVINRKKKSSKRATSVLQAPWPFFWKFPFDLSAASKFPFTPYIISFFFFFFCVPSVIWSLSISTRIDLRTMSRTIIEHGISRDEASRATLIPETRIPLFYKKKEPAMFLLLLIYR